MPKINLDLPVDLAQKLDAMNAERRAKWQEAAKLEAQAKVGGVQRQGAKPRRAADLARKSAASGLGGEAQTDARGRPSFSREALIIGLLEKSVCVETPPPLC